jgi:hypothetical protein
MVPGGAAADCARAALGTRFVPTTPIAISDNRVRSEACRRIVVSFP